MFVCMYCGLRLPPVLLLVCREREDHDQQPSRRRAATQEEESCLLESSEMSNLAEDLVIINTLRLFALSLSHLSNK